MLVVSKTLNFLQNTFLSSNENETFMWVQDCHEQGIPIDSIMIQEKVKSYDNLKQKEVKDWKLENLMLAKDGLIILGRSLTLKVSR